MQNSLKQAYLTRPVYQVETFKTRVMAACHWTAAQFSHKLHGRTAINPLEETEINKIVADLDNGQRHDIKYFTEEKP